MKKISANGYRNIDEVSFEEFTSREEKDNAINEFFADFEKPFGITTDVIGYLVDEDTNERIGYIEESYVDSGSVDYYYTALIHG
jgi:hypothetical protein